MGEAEKHGADTLGLEQTLRDLVALSSLPAVWVGLPPEALLASLAKVLATTLDLELAYVRFAGTGPGPAEALCGNPGDADEVLLEAARVVLERTGSGATTIAIPSRPQPLPACVIPLGIDGSIGSIVVASTRAGFPLENEFLLLRVGANQAAVALQRHLGEQALARGNARFRDLADAAPAMLWVTEPDGSCSFLSRGWYDFTAQARDAGLGFGWTEAIHPEDRPMAARAFQDANANRCEFSLEHRLHHADGSYRWVIDAGRPRFSPQGEFLGFVGNVLDIDDRKRAEEALHETRTLLSTVIDALPVGVAVVDRAGKVVLSNREMHRYLPTNVLPSMDDARRQRWSAVHPDGRPFAPEDFAGARALRGERVVPGMEALYTDDDGHDIWTQIAAVPLAGSDGRPNGQVTVVMNVDTFKRTEGALRVAEEEHRRLFDELKKSNKNLSQFLAVLAHELRNPLAPIMTGMEVLRMRTASPETMTQVRGIIERQVRQLSHLVDDLLDLARVTNGKVEIKRVAAELNAIVSSAVETSLPLIEQGHHTFSMRLHDAALPLHADPVRIAQVINNLLTNASKYTPRGGHIKLLVERDRNEAVISVIDDGIGIPPDALESVFDMFSQVGRNMEHAQGGLGIGLSLVRQLVGLHGGTVVARSEGVGHGSSFVVRLPLALASSPAGSGAAMPDKAAVQRSSLRVLVTDDNVDAATTLAALLEMHGHQVHVANDGPSALDLARRILPQLVFLDIGMPGMSGYEVARAMRRIAGLEHCAIAAVTGWGTADDRRRSKEAGFDAHFTKPLAPAELAKYVDSLVVSGQTGPA